MQAIQTTYHPPSNTRGARIVARCDAGRLTVPYDTERERNAPGYREGNHTHAAGELARKLGWSTTRMVSGALPSGAYAHVFVPADAHASEGK